MPFFSFIHYYVVKFQSSFQLWYGQNRVWQMKSSGRQLVTKIFNLEVCFWYIPRPSTVVSFFFFSSIFWCKKISLRNECKWHPLPPLCIAINDFPLLLYCYWKNQALMAFSLSCTEYVNCLSTRVIEKWLTQQFSQWNCTRYDREN